MATIGVENGSVNRDGFRELLRGHREALGLSIFALAGNIGIDHVYLGRIERGERFPSSNIVRLFIKELNLVPPDSDRLLFAAGYSPNSLDQIGWDDALENVASVLTDPQLSPGDKEDYRRVIIAVSRWAKNKTSSTL